MTQTATQTMPFDAMPVAIFAGSAPVTLYDVLHEAYGSAADSFKNVYIGYLDASYASAAHFSYWDPASPHITRVLKNGTDIGGTNTGAGADWPPQNGLNQSLIQNSDFKNVTFDVGNNIFPNIFVEVDIGKDPNHPVYQELNVSIVPTNISSSLAFDGVPRTISGSGVFEATPPTPADIVAVAHQFEAAYGGGKILNENDCHWIATDIAAAAGAPLDPMTQSTSPWLNEEGGFWRIAYRGTDPGADQNWQKLVQPGDIVRMGTTTGVGFHTVVVLNGPNAEGKIEVFDNGDHGAMGDHWRNFADISISNEVTIYRLAADHTNLINGSDQSETLYGTFYNDKMVGGAGDDTYYVNSVGDQVVENRYDWVWSDRLHDTMQVAGGTDTVICSAGSYQLPDFVENLTLAEGSAARIATGNSLDNIIYGNSDSNIIIGGAGADTMYGGGGSDTYYVDNLGDVVIEHALDLKNGHYIAGGTDTIIALIDYMLPSQVENLTLAEGTQAHNGAGNSLANTIVGNSLANILTGGTNDDIMTGGQSTDCYRFSKGDGHDTITDFKIGEDQIDLTPAGITKLDLRSISHNKAGDAVITYDTGGDSITLTHVTQAQVQSNMASIFHFAQVPGQTFDGTASWGKTVTGTAGADTLTYATQDAGVYVDLVRDGGFSELARIEPDGSRLHGHMTGIENVTGATSYMNTLLGDDRDNILTGGDWGNWFDGRSGNNVLIGGAHTDYADYADALGPVTIDLSVGKAYHGSYIDTLVSIESIRGSYYSDTFIGGKGNDYYYDLGGHDTVYGNDGDDDLAGYAGDTIDGGPGRDTLRASYGDDLFTGGTDRDTFVFGDNSLGRHEITDFNPSEGDHIDFSQHTTALNLRFGNDGHGNAMITYATLSGDATIVLDHVEPNALHGHPEWFIS